MCEDSGTNWHLHPALEGSLDPEDELLLASRRPWHLPPPCRAASAQGPSGLPGLPSCLSYSTCQGTGRPFSSQQPRKEEGKALSAAC